jgi:hypothetical protein
LRFFVFTFAPPWGNQIWLPPPPLVVPSVAACCVFFVWVWCCVCLLRLRIVGVLLRCVLCYFCVCLCAALRIVGVLLALLRLCACRWRFLAWGCERCVSVAFCAYRRRRRSLRCARRVALHGSRTENVFLLPSVEVFNALRD